tara:strand:+ start:879 stop:1079 length:201 start_codon:yes stop_codon:yes gene_type:complete
MNKKGGLMDIVKELLKNMDDESKNSVFLREIALLMEEIDNLNGKLRVKEKLLKNYEKQIKEKNEKK